MFNGYVLYLQAVTTPNPFVKLPKLPFHKSLLLIFCLRLYFPFSFFKLFFLRRSWLFSQGGSLLRLFSCGCSDYFSGDSGYFSAAAHCSGYFSAVAHCFGYFPRVAHCSGYFPGDACGLGYFPGALVIFLRRLTALVIFPGRWLFSCGGSLLWLFSRGGLVIFPRMLAALVISRRMLAASVISRGGSLLWLFFRWLRLFSCGGSGYFPAAAPVISLRWLWLFSRGGSLLWLFSCGGSGYFPAAATLIIVFWTYFYLYKKICPNYFYFWTYELQISLFMSKFLLNFAVFKHISVVLDLYSHFFGHKILFIPDYVQTPSITSISLSNIHKLIYCTE